MFETVSRSVIIFAKVELISEIRELHRYSSFTCFRHIEYHINPSASFEIIEYKFTLNNVKVKLRIYRKVELYRALDTVSLNRDKWNLICVVCGNPESVRSVI